MFTALNDDVDAGNNDDVDDDEVTRSRNAL